MAKRGKNIKDSSVLDIGDSIVKAYNDGKNLAGIFDARWERNL